MHMHCQMDILHDSQEDNDLHTILHESKQLNLQSNGIVELVKGYVELQ